MTGIMSDICQREGCSIEHDTMDAIGTVSGRNLQKALSILNKVILNSSGGSSGRFNRADYDHVYRYCVDIIDTIIKGQTIVSAMDRVRSILYELVNYCVECRTLLPILLNIALTKIPLSAAEERYELAEKAAERDQSIRNSSKDIYHVESFCLHIFYVVKRLMITRQRQIPKIKMKQTGAK